MLNIFMTPLLDFQTITSEYTKYTSKQCLHDGTIINQFPVALANCILKRVVVYRIRLSHEPRELKFSSYVLSFMEVIKILLIFID